MDAVASDPENMSTWRPVVVRDATQQPVVLHFSPVPKASVCEQFFVSASVTILLIGCSPGQAADPSLVRDIFGLTLGEARLASIIANGKPPADAAEMLGITVESARLKRVFAKTGVSRQSELAACSPVWRHCRDRVHAGPPAQAASARLRNYVKVGRRGGTQADPRRDNS